MQIRRRNARVIKIGGVKIGGNNPVSVQSMAKTDTRDVKKTVSEIRRLEKAGCEIARLAVKDIKAAEALRTIRRKINIPLVADIHFDWRLALESIKNGADKIRINPGNISKPGELKEIIKAAGKRRIPIRIGLNSGSLVTKDPSTPLRVNSGRKTRDESFVQTALKYIKLFEKENFHDIIVSLKSSSVTDTVSAYRKLAALCDYPFHLGVTAAGPYTIGIVKSSIGIGALLLDGMGDTIRVSLTGDPVEEVIAAKRILQSLDLRNFGPNIISCPTCGRCQVELGKIVSELERELGSVTAIDLVGRPSVDLRGHMLPKATCTVVSPQPTRSITIAVMGCEVNGPGEAKEADMGIAFGKDTGLLFRKGKVIKKVKAKNAVKELLSVIARVR